MDGRRWRGPVGSHDGPRGGRQRSAWRFGPRGGGCACERCLRENPGAPPRPTRTRRGRALPIGQARAAAQDAGPPPHVALDRLDDLEQADPVRAAGEAIATGPACLRVNQARPGSGSRMTLGRIRGGMASVAAIRATLSRSSSEGRPRVARWPRRERGPASRAPRNRPGGSIPVARRDRSSLSGRSVS